MLLGSHAAASTSCCKPHLQSPSIQLFSAQSNQGMESSSRQVAIKKTDLGSSSTKQPPGCLGAAGAGCSLD